MKALEITQFAEVSPSPVDSAMLSSCMLLSLLRAEARGGSGESILGWHRRAISAYTWCVTEKGPQNKWLHKIKKTDTPACRCQQQEEQSGEHLATRCSLLTRARTQAEKKELLEWKPRHARKKIEKREKGPVEPGKEEEEDKLEIFFCQIYEFHNPPVPAPVFIPAEVPPRYAINFVPASATQPEFSVVSSVSVVSPVNIVPPSAVSARSVSARSVISSANFAIPASVPASSSTDYSVISSANFVVPAASVSSSVPSSSSSTTCIETT